MQTEGLTPVERMNRAIEVGVVLGLKAKEIQRIIESYGYCIELMQVLAQMAEINHRRTQPHKPSPATLRRDAFNESISKLIEPLVKHKLPYTYMLKFLQANNIKHPGTLKQFKSDSLKKYLIDHKLYRKNKAHDRKYSLTYDDYCDRIDLDVISKLKSL